jgi:exosome complex component MTR3
MLHSSRPVNIVMTGRTVKLSNCFVPLPISVLREEKKPRERDSGDGKTRSNHSLRRLLIESDVLSLAPGSALVELGHTKVLCQVHGPVTTTSNLVPSSVQLSMDEGTLYCEVKYLAHMGYPTSTLLASSVSSVEPQQAQFTGSRVNSWTISRETDLSCRLLTALAAAVPLKQYPKCALVVRATVLQDDGSALAACIAAASIALTNASVQVFDLVSCCSVAVQGDGTLLADPDLQEELEADAVVTLAVLPNWKEVSLWEQSGNLSPEQANRAIDLSRDGCRTMHRFLRDHLLWQHMEG